MGLIRSEPIDRLALRRLELLLHHSQPHRPDSLQAAGDAIRWSSMPPWTVERDIDLRHGLFGFGSDIRIDGPEAP